MKLWPTPARASRCSTSNRRTRLRRSPRSRARWPRRSARTEIGRGFVVAEDEVVANTRKGKQVLNVKPPDKAAAVAPVEGEMAAAFGEHRDRSRLCRSRG